MAESVKALPDDIQKMMKVHQWDMRTMEGSRRFFALKAKSLPAIALDGELVYQALIPGQEVLIKEIVTRWRLKNQKESIPSPQEETDDNTKKAQGG
jgi:hypothetical protein